MTGLRKVRLDFAPSSQCDRRSVFTIGIFLGDRWSRYCVLNQAGAVIEEDRVRTTEEGLKLRFTRAAALVKCAGQGGRVRYSLCSVSSEWFFPTICRASDPPLRKTSVQCRSRSST
jgi:hypothetical protein